MRASSASLRASIDLPEEALDFGHDRARLTRFCEVAVASHFHRLLAIRRKRVGGQSNDRYRPRLRVVLEDLRRLPAVNDGDRDVHQDEVRLLGPCLGDTFLAVEGLGYRIAEMAQDGGIDDAVVFVV